MADHCILCGSKDNPTVFIEESIPIVTCQNCNHTYSTYQQDEHYDGYWDQDTIEYDLEWWDKAHRKVYTYFIDKFLKGKSGKLLDVGCGLGFFLKSVEGSAPEWSTTGFEISEQAVKFAVEQNGLPQVKAGMVESGNLEKNAFDTITLWDVIEHLPNPEPLLKHLYDLLKPGGVLYIQTPNFPIQWIKAKAKELIKGNKPGIHYLEVRDHIQNYSEKSLGMMGEKIGFVSTKFEVIPPIMSVSGSRNKLGLFVKWVYYLVTKALFQITGKKVNWNNTLFAMMKK